MSRLDEIGALWSRTGGNGKPYHSGSIMINGQAYEIRVFPNDYKKQPKHPDLKIFLSTPDDQPAPSPEETQPAPQEEPSVDITSNRRVMPPYPDEDINPEDIPF